MSISNLQSGWVAKKPCPRQALCMVKRIRRKIFIKEWRKFRKLSQEKLGEMIGRDGTTVSEIENGNIGYTRETLELLATALECEPYDLISRPPNDKDAARKMITRLLEET